MIDVRVKILNGYLSWLTTSFISLWQMRFALRSSAKIFEKHKTSSFHLSIFRFVDHETRHRSIIVFGFTFKKRVINKLKDTHLFAYCSLHRLRTVSLGNAQLAILS